MSRERDRYGGREGKRERDNVSEGEIVCVCERERLCV